MDLNTNINLNNNNIDNNINLNIILISIFNIRTLQPMSFLILARGSAPAPPKWVSGGLGEFGPWDLNNGVLRIYGKILKNLEKIKRPKNRPESILFNEN